MNRPGPTRPRRSLTAYFSNMLKDTNLKRLHNLDTGLKIVVAKFYRDSFFSSEVIAFFYEDGLLLHLYTFLRITQEPLNNFKV